MRTIARAFRAFTAAFAEGYRLSVDASSRGMTVQDLADIRAEERVAIRRMMGMQRRTDEVRAIVQAQAFAARIREDGRFYVQDDSCGRRVH